MVLEYLPTLGLFKITLGVNVGKYSIHGSSGYRCYQHGFLIMLNPTWRSSWRFNQQKLRWLTRKNGNCDLTITWNLTKKADQACKLTNKKKDLFPRNCGCVFSNMGIEPINNTFLKNENWEETHNKFGYKNIVSRTWSVAQYPACYWKSFPPHGWYPNEKHACSGIPVSPPTKKHKLFVLCSSVESTGQVSNQQLKVPTSSLTNSWIIFIHVPEKWSKLVQWTSSAFYSVCQSSSMPRTCSTSPGTGRSGESSHQKGSSPKEMRPQPPISYQPAICRQMSKYPIDICIQYNIYIYICTVYIYIYIRATPGFCPGVAA